MASGPGEIIWKIPDELDLAGRELGVKSIGIGRCLAGLPEFHIAEADTYRAVHHGEYQLIGTFHINGEEARGITFIDHLVENYLPVSLGSHDGIVPERTLSEHVGADCESAFVISSFQVECRTALDAVGYQAAFRGAEAETGHAFIAAYHCCTAICGVFTSVFPGFHRFQCTGDRGLCEYAGYGNAHQDEGTTEPFHNLSSKVRNEQKTGTSRR